VAETPRSRAGTAAAAPGPPSTPHGAATCSPSGSALTVAALPGARLAYDKDCLAVPAGADFTITFDNQDNGVPHTVDFVNDDSATQTFFSTGRTIGPAKQTFTAPISQFPGPGTYHFRCLIHPAQMVGTFIIR